MQYFEILNLCQPEKFGAQNYIFSESAFCDAVGKNMYYVLKFWAVFDLLLIHMYYKGGEKFQTLIPCPLKIATKVAIE